MTERRGIAAIGNSEDLLTWSGTPYYLLHAGLQETFLTCGLDLRIANLARLRAVWQASRLFHGERPRGFQYSAGFADLLGRRTLAECRKTGLQEIVSHYQALPARYLIENAIKISFYIDATLQDLFETQGALSWLNRTVAEEAIDREIDNYSVAERVVTMSSWVRARLKSSYGVAEERIFTVLPGANLPEREVKSRLREIESSTVIERFARDRKLRIGFTGKDWQRKGLARLLTGVDLLNRMDVPTELVVIGSIPRHYRSRSNVSAAGFIDKSKDLGRFIDTIASCDLGCAPSHEEPMGIAPLEYLRLGVPVVCTAAGGLIDICKAAGSASMLLEKDASPEHIALAIEGLVKSPDSLRKMRASAWERKEYFSWQRAVTELQRVWESGTEFPSSHFRRNATSKTEIYQDA